MIFHKMGSKRPNFNTRKEVLGAGLKSLSKIISDRPIRALEIGCMFSEKEGLSTLEIGQVLCGGSHSFTTIDASKEHIESCKKLISQKDTSILSKIYFRIGRSSDVLVDELAKIEHVDFAFLDGGGDPAVCLWEFVTLLPYLTEQSICIIDDLEEFKPTEAFNGDRPFGKGTLILPTLIQSSYMRDFLDRESNQLIPWIKDIPTLDLRSFIYKMIESAGGHRMLVFGHADLVNSTAQHVSEDPSRSTSSKNKASENYRSRIRKKIIQMMKRSLKK